MNSRAAGMTAVAEDNATTDGKFVLVDDDGGDGGWRWERKVMVCEDGTYKDVMEAMEGRMEEGRKAEGRNSGGA